MINPKLKEAWPRLRNLDYAFRVGDLDALVSVLRNAFIEAEWRRRKAEFTLSFFSEDCDTSADPHHNFTDEQWRDELIAELENG